MATTVYNIVWADDEVDTLLSEKMENLRDEGFNVIAKAHTADELESIVENNNKIDAVIFDFNFPEHDNETLEERDCSGFDKARHIYNLVCKRKIPFFLYTKRNDEFIRSAYAHNPKALDDFPRNERWFFKGPDYDKMKKEIKETINEHKSASFIVRNKYREALYCAKVVNKANDKLFMFLLADQNNTLGEINEPFVTLRKMIEGVFVMLEEKNLIPPISKDTNGTSKYLEYGGYVKLDNAYRCLDKIMPKPVARELHYILDITQDYAHNKKDLKLDVDKYWETNKSSYLLRSVLFAVCDILRWFKLTCIKFGDNANEKEDIWIEIPKRFTSSV